jgi:hypothetical protein
MYKKTSRSETQPLDKPSVTNFKMLHFWGSGQIPKNSKKWISQLNLTRQGDFDVHWRISTTKSTAINRGYKMPKSENGDFSIKFDLIK